VATPIGNLQDMTFRAVEVLRSVSRVVCEDTRRTRILLAHHQLSKPLLSLPAYEEHERREKVIHHLLQGENLALVSDAGTPGISDPGALTVALALQQGIEVIPVPGANAITTALCASGLPSSRFCFLGFLPRAEGQVRRFLKEYASLPLSLVFFESPKRLSKTLAIMSEVLGPRQACIARELTKIHEEFLRAPLNALCELSRQRVWLGEVVILTEGCLEQKRWPEATLDEALEQALFETKEGSEFKSLGLKELSKQLAVLSLWSEREVYQRALHLKKLRSIEG